MNKKDILQIKYDLGLCADTLMSMFMYSINETLGVIYFVLSIVIETVSFIRKSRKR